MKSEAEGTREAAGAGEVRLAFFTHAREDATWRGPMVVVAADGDPLDFVYTEPVAMSRLSLRLLGPRVDGYMIERVLLPPLLEKAGAGVRLICFEDAAILQRRVKLPMPCVVFESADAVHRAGAWVVETALGADGATQTFWVPPDHREPAMGWLLHVMAEMAPFGLAEPFAQLRAAMADVQAS